MITYKENSDGFLIPVYSAKKEYSHPFAFLKSVDEMNFGEYMDHLFGDTCFVVPTTDYMISLCKHKSVLDPTFNTLEFKDEYLENGFITIAFAQNGFDYFDELSKLNKRRKKD
ncbi:MAG: hypothetical protein GQ570_11205 [Helicobacteraceae bacterium]|nr:hypothetical protein [Helicobacteraceae bacterium]